MHPFFSPLSTALKNFRDPDGIYETVDASSRNTYIQWNVNDEHWRRLSTVLGMDLPPMFKTDSEWVERCFAKYDRVDQFLLKTHWRMVLIGQSGAGMFNHKDTLQSTSFQAQVAGRKRWHLCADSESPNLYGAGDVNTFNPDYKKYPKALDLNCYDVIVEAGMMIYYPANYWHQTRNLDDYTVSVSGTLVTEGNTPLISKEFTRECTEQRVRIFQAEVDLCKGLADCMSYWAVKPWEEDLMKDMDLASKNLNEVDGSRVY